MKYMKFLRDVLEEGFKEFVTKFSNDDENINAYVDKFKLLKTRNKIKGVEADIDYWIKKDFKEFVTFVDSFSDSDIKSRKETKKEAYKNVVAENDEYVIIKIDDPVDAYALGKGTSWCIASGNKEEAADYFNLYAKHSDLYFAIKKQLGEVAMYDIASGAANEEYDGKAKIYPYWDKIAIQVEKDQINYWNTGDFRHKELPNDVKLPAYEFVWTFKAPEDWTKFDNGYVAIGNYVPVVGNYVLDLVPSSHRDTIKLVDVMGDFICEFNGDETVDDIVWPEKVQGDVIISSRYITNLEGKFPKFVGGNITVKCEQMKSIGVMPSKVKSLSLENCYSLESIDSSLLEVTEELEFYNCESLSFFVHLPMCTGKVKIRANEITREEVKVLVDEYKNLIINGEDGVSLLDSFDDEDNIVESWLSKYR